jgi:subtilase family serine protease
MANFSLFRPLATRKRKICTVSSAVALAMGVALPALVVAAGLSTTALGASAQPAGVEQVGSLTTPKDLGRVVSGQEQTISVYLNLHDQAGFDQAVSALYDPASPTFHQWFTDADFAKYAPTDAELQTVRAELERQGLKTVSVDPLNFSLRVRGSTSAIESAFQTEVHNYSYGKSVVQAPIREPKLAGSAGDLVAATVGVERHQAHPLWVTSKGPQTGKPLLEFSISPSQTFPDILRRFVVQKPPLSAPMNTHLQLLGRPLPNANYYGPVLATDPFQYIDYTPSQLQDHYGLTSLINQGYDGRGQKIALVEAYGYAAAEADANLAASTFGLPPLDSNTFQVIYPSGQPLTPNAADLVGWTTEIALDIQSAHAIAPGAQIVEVAAAGQDDESLIAALEYIVTHRVATIVSGSWEVNPELISGPAEEQAFKPVLQRMAAAGISMQLSSGDSGDFGLGTPRGAVSVPSNSPYVTAVGGTSLLNDPLGSGDLVTGWGNSAALLMDQVQLPDPPQPVGFIGGAGGGESLYWSKPSWQRSIPGTGRQVPDVSALADPYTGVPIVVTSGGAQYGVLGVGGTSLASPLFSAIWAIAQQYNHETLGQAAPTIARLKPGQITDVVGTSDLTPYSLTGTITTSSGSTSYSTADIFAGIRPAIAQSNYLAVFALLPPSRGVSYAFTFGTDTSLTVGPGWDNVTGYGEPNGLPFIQAVGSKHK